MEEVQKHESPEHDYFYNVIRIKPASLHRAVHKKTLVEKYASTNYIIFKKEENNKNKLSHMLNIYFDHVRITAKVFL